MRAFFLSTVAALFVAELLLTLLVPLELSTIGRRDSRNAAIYGWGYDGGETIRLRDPDTGEVFTDSANDSGWRDRSRAPGDNGMFRVLVLGDSNTFGMIVRREELWTLRAEDALQAKGYGVEVLNMSYPGWGTDHALEAYLHEGRDFVPDLVVVQFTVNDLADNVSHLSRNPGLKPFLYELGSDGALARRANPRFGELEESPGWRGNAKRLIHASQILRRAYAAYMAWKFERRREYVVHNGRLLHLRTVFGGSAAGLEADLREFAAKAGATGVREADLSRVIRAHLPELGASGKRVLRFFENRLLHDFWFPLQYRPKPLDTEGERWRLFVALLDEIVAKAGEQGADVALWSDQEQGLFEWELYWSRVADEYASRRNYFHSTVLLRELAARQGVGFVQPVSSVERARNDPHPNGEGNRVMAESLVDYLIQHHGGELPPMDAATQQEETR